MLSCHILRTIPSPLDLYNPYGSIPKMFSLSVQYAHQMHLQDALLLYLLIEKTSISTWSRPRYQTLASLQPMVSLPHMPVPPQECALLLSHSPSAVTPPFPWALATSQTGSLRALWLEEFLLPSEVSNRHLPRATLCS